VGSALSDAVTKTQALLDEQVKKFNNELRQSVLEQFSKLNETVANMPAIVKLKADILEEVDKRIQQKTPPAK
jgi:hypothetical protein